jgi:UDP-N-acetylglucosamine:LPS N-acetylglucosamine transferase
MSATAVSAPDGSGEERTGAGTGRVLLVCSPGGHLFQMQALRPAWDGLDRTWVTLPGADVEHLLAGERVVLAHGPTNRSISMFLRNILVAWREIHERPPDAVLSTGAALAVPFFIIGKLHRRRCVYVESLTRTVTLSLSGRLVYPLADAFFVQWPTAARRRARYTGSILE